MTPPPKRVNLPLTLVEFQMIIDALDAYSDAAELAMSVGYDCLTQAGRRKLDDKRVDLKRLRGELFKRLEAQRAGEDQA